jgi:hypothetical protein
MIVQIPSHHVRYTSHHVTPFCTTQISDSPLCRKCNFSTMNNDLSYTERHEWARDLYVKLEKSVKDTAGIAGVDEATVRNWINDGSWDAVKRSRLISKETQLEQLYSVLEELKKTILNDGPSMKNAEQYNKYVSAIRTLETDTSVSGIIDAAKAFISWLRRKDLNFAKKVTVQFDKFIKHRMAA